MVEISNFTLSYPNGEKVLHTINLEIQSGECVLLTGESGSGKSSLINSINGLATRYDGCTYTGELKVCGKDTAELPLYEISMMISSVFQNPKTYFFNVNTTLELLFFLENIGLSKEEMDKRLEEMLELFPIQHLLNRDIFKLSGGEKQILCIAAAYISGVKIIVLDEPSSNLDDKYTSIMATMLMQLKQRGITLIIAEHRIYYLMNIADTVYVLDKGEIINRYEIEEFLKIDREELSERGLRSRQHDTLIIKDAGKEGSLSIKELRCQFSKNKGIKVENLVLKQGCIYGIVGNNGCGKSTFIRSLIGAEKTSKDEIYLKEEKLSKKKRIKISSLVMQDVNHQLFTDSVIEEVNLGAKQLKEGEAEGVLEKLGLSAFKESHPMSLSGGQKQRVAIASVLLAKSSILCFDEPTSGMDYKNMIKISKLIRSFIDKEKIILIVSHDIEFLNITVDGMIFMQDYVF